MGLKIGGADVSNVYIGGAPASAVYVGPTKVWPTIEEQVVGMTSSTASPPVIGPLAGYNNGISDVFIGSANPNVFTFNGRSIRFIACYRGDYGSDNETGYISLADANDPSVDLGQDFWTKAILANGVEMLSANAFYTLNPLGRQWTYQLSMPAIGVPPSGGWEFRLIKE